MWVCEWSRVPFYYFFLFLNLGYWFDYFFVSLKGNGFLFGLRTGERKNINSELWHACAGPLVSLPPVGSLVVYFPQGHSEQVHTLSFNLFEHVLVVIGLWWIFLFLFFKPFRSQRRWTRRLISFQTTLTFLQSWSACSIMSHYTYEGFFYVP